MSDEPDYSELEDLLFRGFLTTRVYIEGKQFLLKTLNENEKRLIWDHIHDRDSQFAYISYALAYSTYMVDRYNVLPHRPAIIHELVDCFENMNRKAVKKIFLKAKILNEKAANLMSEVQPYSYGFESEQMWYVFQNITFGSVQATGVEGTEKLGMNFHQKIWCYLNQMKERQEKYDRDFDLFSFVASASNPKGANKVVKKHNKNRNKREKEQERAYKNKVMNTVEERGNEIWITNESEQDLIDELEKSLSGQKDFHDQVVEQYEKRMADEFREKKRQIQEERERRRKEQEKIKGPVKQRARFYDPKQAEQFTAEKRQKQKENIRKGAYAASAEYEEQERMLGKWGLIDTDRDDLYEHAPDLNQQEQEDPEGSFYEDTVLEDYIEPMNDDLEGND